MEDLGAILGFNCKVVGLRCITSPSFKGLLDLSLSLPLSEYIYIYIHLYLYMCLYIHIMCIIILTRIRKALIGLSLLIVF